MINIAQANAILECDDIFKKNPHEYGEYFVVTSNNEAALTANQKTIYNNLKINFASARSAFIKRKTPENATKFINDYNILQAFKITHNFTFTSLVEFHSRMDITQEDPQQPVFAF